MAMLYDKIGTSKESEDLNNKIKDLEAKLKEKENIIKALDTQI